MIVRVYIFTVLSLSMFMCQRKGEDCVYLLPNGFEGNVIIVFNQKEGQKAVRENGRRVYQIDRSGVLRTEFSENYGLHKSSFYELNENGERKGLSVSSFSKQPTASSEVFIYGLEAGKDFDYTISANRHFELFTVSSERNIDSIGNLKSSFMWEKLKSGSK